MELPNKTRSAFTILEVAFSTCIVAFTMSAICLTHSNTLSVVKKARRSVNVSQILQEKSEMLRELTWTHALDSGTVSGTGCLGGSATDNETNLQSVSRLTETVQVMEYPAGQPAPTAGYTVVRTVNFPVGSTVPTAAATVSPGAVAISSTLSKIYVCINATYQLSGTTAGGRDFEMVICNPLK